MNTISKKILLSSFVIASLVACKKGEGVISDTEKSVATTTDSATISTAASQQIKDKLFIKSADVNMEVKDVYETTIFIEKNLKEIGGFVTNSKLNSQIISDETYNTSDENATLVRKFQTENLIQVRIPTEKLGEFLTFVNNKKLFLNSRTISAEDVTNNAKIAELELKKFSKTSEVVSKMKNNEKKVELTEENISKSNTQQVENLNFADNLKYSTVDIYIKEPKIRVAEIAVTNTRFFDNKYKFNFLYDVKNAFVEGFYFLQQILVFMVSIWWLFLFAGIFYYFWNKRKSKILLIKTENTQI